MIIISDFIVTYLLGILSEGEEGNYAFYLKYGQIHYRNEGNDSKEKSY